MNTHYKFAVGAAVNFRSPHASKSGLFNVTRHVPEGRDGDLQYRIKSETENVERVVREAEISEVS